MFYAIINLKYNLGNVQIHIVDRERKVVIMRKLCAVVCSLIAIFALAACSHTHTWEEATCTTPKTCSECGATEGEALGHKWAEATCTEAKTCSVCGETEGKALGHTWVEATCTEAKTCSECGATEGEPLGHTVESWKTVEKPNCTTEGTKTGKCSRCGDTVEDSIPKTEHTLGKWVVSKNATATSAGERSQSCTVCGEVINTEEFTLSPEEIEAEYKASCVTYDYNTIARDPDKYMYTYGKYTGEIIQVLEDGNELQLRINITQERYGYTDTIFVVYTLKDGESRLLENDIVTVYGMNMGTISYESVLGATVTIPCVYAEYIDLN